MTVQVVRAGDESQEASVSYTTVDGDGAHGAKAGEPGKGDYEASAGTLTFKAGQVACDITIKIFDDDEIETAVEAVRGRGGCGTREGGR